MADTVFAEFSPIYGALGRAYRWTPDQVDGMEIWQVANAFDALVPLDQRDKVRPSRPMKPGAAPVLTGSALLAARVRHAKGEGPKPEAAPLRGDEAFLGRLR